MRFGPTPAADAAGAILAHSRKVAGRVFRKGRVLSVEDAAALVADGVDTVIAARLDAGDVPEDEAATRIAAAASGPGLAAAAAFTGRANLIADTAGVVVVDRDRLDRLNLLDEAVTVATLPPFTRVEPGQMAATIKIIPFAAPEAAVGAAERIAAEGGALVRVAPFRALAAALIQTRLPGMKDSVLDKTVAVTRARLAPLGAALVSETRTGHDAGAVAAAVRAALDGGAGLVLIAGASAIVDRRDVIPAGIEAAGGTVEHFGMPVDPGNLLLLGRVDPETLGLSDGLALHRLPDE